MIHQFYRIGALLAAMAVGWIAAGCAAQKTIPPQTQVRDPEELDTDTAAAVDLVEEALVGVPISPDDFGVPTYPGAQSVYTEKLGSEEADGEFKTVQLATPDPLEHVASFYEQEIGAEAERQPVTQRNSVMFVWRQGQRVGQTLLIAEDGTGQTIITVSQTHMSEGNPLMLDTSTLRPKGKATPEHRYR